jgi:hypothetical protein
VVPGDYTVALSVGGRELTRTLKVEIDPRASVTAADLEAQRVAGLEMRDLTARVNQIVGRTDDLIAQLSSLAEILRRGAAAGAGAAGNSGTAITQVTAALERLRTFRNDSLARPLPGLGYRQYPRLREEVQTLNGVITRSIARPTDPEGLRARELVQQTDRMAAILNAFITKDIAQINQVLQGTPHVIIGGPLVM